MSERQKIIETIYGTKIVVIVRGMQTKDMVPLAEALNEAGIRLLEMTFNQSDAAERTETARCISLLREKLGDRMYFGAGTVMNVEQMKLAMSAGAQFLISPHTNTDVISQTVAKGLVSMPGAFTPTEIQTAHEAGADFVKVFPIDAVGPGYLKSVIAPLNNIPLIAVGSVDLPVMKGYWDAGCVGFGMGSIIDRAAVAAGDFARVTEKAKAYTALADSLVR